MPDQSENSSTSGGGVRRLVLCFDGTGNKFQADESNTNIVKIYQMLERTDPDQFHYYQPGIGTYSKNQGGSSSGITLWTRFKSHVWSNLDQMLGSSFVDHVLAGYQFIMRYYVPGDHIYMFGFSRGAYQARFLAEMIHNIGLLSRGNEEMVHFAWETFSNYQIAIGHDPQTEADAKVKQYMETFKETFCRPHITVHFLGLFDCVNSVGQFELPFNPKSYRCIATPAATYIRHAVAIHERRLKFKPALFQFDETIFDKVDVKEEWFAGNHGDVGGGWPLQQGQTALLSDTPLRWMINELDHLPGSESKLKFKDASVSALMSGAASTQTNTQSPTSTAWQIRRSTMQPHDLLCAGPGVRWFKALCWWIVETIPLFARLELESGKWVPRYWPPNLGAGRDLPTDATVNESVDDLVKEGILAQAPRKGGDNPHFPVLFSKKASGAMQKRKSKQGGAEEQAPLLRNGTM